MVIMLVLSTIYLRHHYVIDLIAGLFLAIFAFWIGPKLEDWWKKVMNRNLL
jgi:membrane-associated phospholipid phosphatase